MKSRFIIKFGPGRMSQLVECRPVHPKVVGLIPGEGTYLGCVQEATDGCSPRPLFLKISKSKANKHISSGEEQKGKTTHL